MSRVVTIVVLKGEIKKYLWGVRMYIRTFFIPKVCVYWRLMILCVGHTNCDLITLSSLTLLEEPEGCFPLGGIVGCWWCRWIV